ncbi:hypothetical protein [Caproicibacter fermentans]|uniref:Uncharacterized protein n=1 Tax=Caproicibacter fermentans TaxID=2576756 RepID=A0A7G8T899_9FIRM|nr:hypothetical protein [Caproicibacter fermentans]QNK39840.1 hypothetical protein HCR03_14100 [Caproicibacter fermentans]
MELKELFLNLNAQWVRWSDYEIAEVSDVQYIRPVKVAEPIPYNCAEKPEDLVVNALNAGMKIWHAAPDLDRACLDFARRYGLLGFGTSNTTAQNLFFGAGAQDERAESAGTSPYYNGVFSRSYGEPFDRFKAKFTAIYAHFLAAQGHISSPAEQEKLRKAWERDFSDGIDGLTYQLTFGEKPELLWKPRNLLTVLRLAYSGAATDPAAPLKLCKFCGNAYYSTNPRSEFCSATCRNHFNVNTFRRRKKDAETGSECND